MAYVVDDPKLLFQMQGDGSIAQTGLGNNVSSYQHCWINLYRQEQKRS